MAEASSREVVVVGFDLGDDGLGSLVTLLAFVVCDSCQHSCCCCWVLQGGVGAALVVARSNRLVLSFWTLLAAHLLVRCRADLELFAHVHHTGCLGSVPAGR